MIKNFKWLFLVAITFLACNSDDEVVVVNNSSDGQPLTAGSADFSKYVALGDSYAAGFSDGALFIEGQKGSYPNLLAQQFAQVGGGVFKQPLMADNVGGMTPSLLGQFPRLVFNGVGPVSLALPPYNQVSTTTLAPVTGGINNFGVPGAKSFHLIAPGYGDAANLPLGTANPYFVRMVSGPGKTVLQDAISQNATFFSLLIGGNDVLGYALSGGDGSNPITPNATFDLAYNTIIDGMTTGNKKGAIANIPYITSFPAFTTVAYNSANLPAATATAVNAAYAAYNAGIAGSPLTAAEKTKRTINFVAGANGLVILDENLTDLGPSVPKLRQATAADLILLQSGGVSAQSHIMAGNGISAPLADKWVLTADEILELKVATDAYNVTIAAAAAAKNLALVDAKTLLQQVSTVGVSANGYTIKSTYVTGGAFSLDGFHPSPRGYALIANAFTKAINAKYGSNFKDLDYSFYRILFPASL